MLLSAAILALIALAQILFSSPLFATLGFEYSALMALALSFVCGVRGVEGQRTVVTVRAGILRVVRESAILAVVPLVVSIISLLFLPNCFFWDGLLFYLEIALPSAILGGLFGLAIAMLIPNRTWAWVGFIAFWVVTLFLSLLPGYTNPQLFAYGWQYGFFPGIIWDASIELKNAYLFSRIEQVVWVALLFSIGALRVPLPEGTTRTKVTYTAVLCMLGIVLFLLHDTLGITASHRAVERELSEKLVASANCTIYYAPNSFTEDELSQMSVNVRWYLYDIERRFALEPPAKPVHIYIYPSNKAMFQFVGTSVASIAKPWLGEVDIATGHLENLKHELTHVMLRAKGVWPFYASWSTGVTEGAAMSVEPEYDGIYTLDEHAARILQLHYARGVSQILSFSGFAANASEKSYVLAGSFARYLLRTYGPGPFDRVYSSLDWKNAYGKPLDTLEREWKRSLQSLMTSMSAADSAHFRYYYDRTAIIFDPCLRRIGKLERKAGEAYAKSNFAQADKWYASAVAAGGGIGALAGRSNALLREQKLDAATTVLDTTQAPTIQKQILALDERRGDLHAIQGDTIRADSFYHSALLVKLSGGSFLSAYAHQVLLHSQVDSEWTNFLRAEYLSPPDATNVFEGFLKVWMHHHPEPGFDRTDLVLRYLYATLLERKGEYAGAVRLDPFGISLRSPELDSGLSRRDSLAISLIALHFAEIEIPNPHAQYDLSVAEQLVPTEYRRAITEMVDELSAEAAYTTEAQRAPGTSP